MERDFQRQAESMIDGEKVVHGMGLTQILGAWEYIDDVLLDGKADIIVARNVLIDIGEAQISFDFYKLKDVVFQHLVVESYNLMVEMGGEETAQSIVDSFRKS